MSGRFTNRLFSKQTVLVGNQVVDYYVNIDYNELKQLALKAHGNKSKKTHIGPLQVEIVQTKAVK